MEKINVYNANLELIGERDRKEVHMSGLWHTTFHCWVASRNNNGQMLFQLRSADVLNFPNMLDVTAAGHILSTETVDDGIREVGEELGIKVNKEDLYDLGYRVEVMDQDNGQKNREYQSVHLLELNLPLSEYNPQVEEVSGLLWIKIEDGINLFTKKVEKINARGIIYDKDNKTWCELEKNVTVSDFIPRIQNYYLTMFIMSDRLLKKQFPLAIS